MNRKHLFDPELLYDLIAEVTAASLVLALILLWLPLKVRGRRPAHPPSGSGRNPASARCAALSGSFLLQQGGERLVVR